MFSALLDPPADLTDGWQPETDHRSPRLEAAETYDRIAPPDLADPEAELGLAALLRNAMAAPEPTDADIAHQFDRADALAASPVGRDRLLLVNQLTQHFYAARFPGSWAQDYLTDRIGADLTGHPLVQPGHAPAGWTSLIQHLRRHGITDTEMLCAGVARTAATGRLIDQFRDRLTFPVITDSGEILGFVGRRNPAAPDQPTSGPKYLNTGQTPLFCKGDQFYGTIRSGQIPVIVEGPLDAIAVTLVSRGRYTGLAPLGTALTDQQAALLTGHPDVIIATDADLAGHVAAERDYWQLTPYGLDPRRAVFPAGTDPADHLANHGPTALSSVLDQATSLAQIMITERTSNLTETAALDQATEIAAARPARHWDLDSDRIAAHLDIPLPTVREALARNVRTWNQDPRQAARQIQFRSTEVRRRLEAAAKASRWTQLANTTDPRLTRQPDWPHLQHTLEHAHQLGHDVEAAVRELATPDRASRTPAHELSARLITALALNNEHLIAQNSRDTRHSPNRRTPPPPRPGPRPAAPSINR